MKNQSSIGFIGLGVMGEPICRNLAQKSGVKVLASDLDKAPLERLASDKVEEADIASGAQIGVSASVRCHRERPVHWWTNATRGKLSSRPFSLD